MSLSKVFIALFKTKDLQIVLIATNTRSPLRRDMITIIFSLLSNLFKLMWLPIYINIMLFLAGPQQTSGSGPAIQSG